MTHVRKVLEAAVRAPSGENAQPWRFVIREQGENATVDVHLRENSDTSFYNYENRAAYVALGACVENIRIAASAHGYHAHTELFPSPNDSGHVARIQLTVGSSTLDPRAEFIFKRVTNRKPFTEKKVSEEFLATLTHTAQTQDIQVTFSTIPKDIQTLAQVGASNEALMLGNRQLHNFFFSHVNWTKEEDEQKRSGFFIRSLELPPPAQVGFKILRSWRRCRVLTRLLRFNEVVAKQNARIYATAPVFGVLTAPVDSPQCALAAGRSFQLCWLEATRLGLSLQPLMGTLFLGFAADAGAPGLTDTEKAYIQENVQTIRRVFAIENRIPFALFRLGYAPEPSAQTVRHDIDDVTEWI